MFCYREAKEVENQYTTLFGCGSGQYPFRYLGIPMHHRKINNADRKVIEEKFELLKRKVFVIRRKTGFDKFGFEQFSYIHAIFL
jgi:hypothetical protein